MQRLRGTTRLATALLAATPLASIAFVCAHQDEERPEFWTLAEQAAVLHGVGSELAVVLEHMAGIPERHAALANRIVRVDRALRAPWLVPELASELRAELAAPLEGRGDERFATLVPFAANWLDVELRDDPVLAELETCWARVADPETSGRAWLEATSALFERAHVALDEALGPLSPEAWSLLFEGHEAFAEGWYRSHFPDVELAPELAAAMGSFSDALLLRPLHDRARVLGVANVLMRFAEPGFCARLARRFDGMRAETVPTADMPAEYGDDALAVVGDAPRNRVVLAGKRAGAHGQACALLIDLGGDDRYARAAVVDSPELLASVVIDLAGDDEYVGTARGPAYAAGGVALLVDRKGNDRYRCGRLGEAASALGVALLVDHEGNDEYAAQDHAQAHALCGVALLYDLDGDDRYTAWACAQGGGIGYGLSALVDGAGDDAYLADLQWPDVYGDSGPEVYHGASQGYCTGLRPSIAGGVAALVDLGNGADRYQSGNFSQGGGYYFSFGLMDDGGGDDVNLGTRYSQGFGVHQAIGVRHDAGGDDSYTCRSVAHAGMAWDEGVGFLLEDAGDDVYAVGDLACGGAAQTGVAFCIDRDGADSYTSGAAGQGDTGASEYHAKPALGVLLDLGGDADEHSLPERRDERLRVTPGVGVFLDTSARDERQALRSKLLRER